MSTAGLLRSRRFAGFFWTQFLGAFNDNVFRSALVILVTYRGWSVAGLGPGAVVALAGGLFIVPFVLLSPVAGRLADAASKSRVVRWTKAAEVLLMLATAPAFAAERPAVLLALLCCMGAQSAVFGPVKYGIVPELVPATDLMAANALVETGTFLAILLGTLAGGALIGLGATGPMWVGGALVLIAAAGFAASLAVPPLAAASPGLPLARGLLATFRDTIEATCRAGALVRAILGLAWFWFFGSAVLALLPPYTRDVLGGTEGVVTLFLGLFCAGIGAGSVLSARLSGDRIRLGLVPAGAVGMSLFALDLALAGAPAPAGKAPLGVAAFLRLPGSWRLMADLTGLAAAGGLFTVPLYAFLQARAAPAERARVIAGNNILGALFMVASAVAVAAGHEARLGMPAMFGLLGLANGGVAWAAARAARHLDR